MEQLRSRGLIQAHTMETLRLFGGDGLIVGIVRRPDRIFNVN